MRFHLWILLHSLFFLLCGGPVSNEREKGLLLQDNVKKVSLFVYVCVCVSLIAEEEVSHPLRFCSLLDNDGTRKLYRRHSIMG